MIIAYRFFEESGECVATLFKLLNKTALEVCEGQQYDVDLEKAALNDSFVSEEMYLKNPYRRNRKLNMIQSEHAPFLNKRHVDLDKFCLPIFHY